MIHSISSIFNISKAIAEFRGWSEAWGNLLQDFMYYTRRFIEINCAQHHLGYLDTDIRMMLCWKTGSFILFIVPLWNRASHSKMGHMVLYYSASVRTMTNINKSYFIRLCMVILLVILQLKLVFGTWWLVSGWSEQLISF